jgi:hypothetical protein
MGELREQGVNVVLHRLSEAVAELLGHGGYHPIEVKVGVSMEEMAEDARRRLEEEVAAFIFNDAVHPLGTSLEPLHELGEEVDVAGVVGLAVALEPLLADGGQGTMGPKLEGAEHLGALVLPPPRPVRLQPRMLDDIGDTTHLQLEGG